MKKLLLTLFAFICAQNVFALNFQSYSPITSTNVPIYTKFELGVQLDIAPPAFNPYDYDAIQVRALFTSPSGKSYAIDAFWYQDFIRNTTAPDPTFTQCGFKDLTDSWLSKITTNQPWRIRFSPDEMGQWKYAIYAIYNQSQIATPTQTFSCVRSTDPGYITTDAKSGRAGRNPFFCFTGTESTFVPVGLNTTSGAKWSVFYNRIPYVINTTVTSLLQQNGGNMIRIMMNPEQFQIEWGPNANGDGLRSYERRQDRSYDLDAIFSLAEANQVYIQLCMDVQSELTPPDNNGNYVSNLYWNGNPYNTSNGGIISNSKDFFTNSACVNNYKNKLRYIIARWGYSAHLMSYELFNEVDQFSPEYWNDGSMPGKVTNWHKEVINFAKLRDYDRHLYTTSTTGPSFGSLYDLSEIDYTSVHYYTSDYNSEYQKNCIERGEVTLHKKPMIFGEVGKGSVIGNCTFGSNSFMSSTIYDQIEYHNNIWSTSFGGNGGPGVYWTNVNDVIKIDCWGGQYLYHRPLADFLTGEDNLFKNGKAIANKASSSGPKDQAYGNAYPGAWPSIDAPVLNLPSWWFANTNQSFYDPFITNGITTSDDDNIQVFALQGENRIIGWVANKKNYWYGLPHTSGCSNIVDNMPMTYPGGVTTLNQQTVTINNLQCDGRYKIEFYSTYPSYDINNDGTPDNGGIIPAFTINDVSVHCGTLTFTVPQMSALKSGVEPYAPDYGFKISKVEDAWKHDIVNNTAGQTSTYVIAASTNHVFYKGTDGRLQHMWPTSNYTWQHEWKTNWNDNSENVGSSICVNADATHVFYGGADHRLHHYYYVGNSIWQHEIISSSSNSNENVDGTVTCGDNGYNVFYRGADGKLHQIYQNNGTWHHMWLTNWNNNSEDVGQGGVATNADATHVYYQGVDDRLHHYYYVSNSIWQHEILSNPGNENVVGSLATSANGYQVFYKGADGRLHQYYQQNGIWNHMWLTNWNNNSENVAGQIAVNDVADHVIYVGADGYVNQYYYIGNGQWGHDNVICWDDLQNTYQPAWGVAYDNDKVFYAGLDQTVQTFYFNNGCTPRPLMRKINALSVNSFPDNSLAQADHSIITDGKTIGINSINIYPIPCNNELNISFSNVGEYYIELQSMLGTTLLKQRCTNTLAVLNTSNIPAGMYIMIVKDAKDKTIYFKKISKM